MPHGPLNLGARSKTLVMDFFRSIVPLCVAVDIVALSREVLITQTVNVSCSGCRCLYLLGTISKPHILEEELAQKLFETTQVECQRGSNARVHPNRNTCMAVQKMLKGSLMLCNWTELEYKNILNITSTPCSAYSKPSQQRIYYHHNKSCPRCWLAFAKVTDSKRS